VSTSTLGCVRQAIDASPPKHEQVCDGRVTRVNSYTERDRDLVEEALHAYFAKDTSVASNDSGF
jgi:hypothetical protein